MIGHIRAAAAGLLLAAVAATPAAAQERLFSDSSEIQLVFDAPMTTLLRQASRSTDPVPAAVTITAGGAPERFELQLSAGGISRRTGGICSFPPLRLNFVRGELAGTILQGQNKLKLTTRCRNGSRYEQISVLEYTAYRLYNEITPFSFRVRPAQVTYRDSEGRRREETQFNFLIEALDEVAHRNGRRVALDVPPDAVRSSQLDPQAATLYGLFQYMIGNLDWDMVSDHPGDDCCHNSKLIAASETSRAAVVPVPYDFDYAGFVNAPYAIPPEGLPVSNVRTRYYRGYCRFNDQLPAAVAHLQARRAAIFAVIDNEPRMTDATRRSARGYIEDFFAILDDPDRFDRQVVRRCRG